MKKLGFTVLFIIFIGGILCIRPDKYPQQQVQMYQARYNNANTGPLVFHVPTNKEVNTRCANERYVSCDIRSHHEPCYIDQFGNWWQNGKNMQYQTGFPTYHCSLTDTKLAEMNKDEENFFKKNGITKTEYNYKRDLDSARKYATNSRLKNILKFIVCYFLFLALGWVLIILWKKFGKSIKNFFIPMNVKNYLILLASLATLSLICIAIKLCL